MLNAEGQSLLAVDNRDARAAGEYFEVAEKMGQQLLEQQAPGPCPCTPLLDCCGSRISSRKTSATVRTVFGMGEWLNYKLCGVRAIDASLASATGLFHLRKNEWCWPLIDELDLPREIFPPVVDSGAPVGELTAEAAAHLGLDPAF